jgi:hypothetical protein
MPKFRHGPPSHKREPSCWARDSAHNGEDGERRNVPHDLAAECVEEREAQLGQADEVVDLERVEGHLAVVDGGLQRRIRPDGKPRRGARVDDGDVGEDLLREGAEPRAVRRDSNNKPSKRRCRCEGRLFVEVGPVDEARPRLEIIGRENGDAERRKRLALRDGDGCVVEGNDRRCGDEIVVKFLILCCCC